MYNHTFPSFLEHASFHLSRSSPEWAERRNCNRRARRVLQGQRSTDCDTARRKHPLNRSKPTDPGKHLFNNERTCDLVQWTNSWCHIGRAVGRLLSNLWSADRPTDCPGGTWNGGTWNGTPHVHVVRREETYADLSKRISFSRVSKMYSFVVQD